MSGERTEPGPAKSWSERSAEARRTARAIGTGLLVALLLRAFVVEAYEIPTGSMIPTLEVGDRVVVSKLTYGARLPFTQEALVSWSSPERGDIVVFSDPQRGIDLIKRVVAVGGDTIEVRKDVLHVNGRPVEREPLPGDCRYSDRAPGPRDGGGAGWAEYRCQGYTERLGQRRYVTIYAPYHQPSRLRPRRVPDGHIFVMGDHRDSSADSRVFGPVPVSRVRGRAVAVFWSRGPRIRWERLARRVH